MSQSGYILVLLPAFILSLYASGKVKSSFAKYANVRSSSGLTGADVARNILASEGIHDVSIEHIRGTLTDHYDPRAKVVRLSNDVYGSSSISAISVAAHECGHAVQHNKKYFPLRLRTAFVPIANICSRMSMPFIFLGIILSYFSQGAFKFIDIGIVLFAGAVLFQFITLPVEFNASRRAIKILLSNGYITEQESKASGEVLKAAALTYVASALSALSSLIRMILISNNSQNE